MIIMIIIMIIMIIMMMIIMIIMTIIIMMIIVLRMMHHVRSAPDDHAQSLVRDRQGSLTLGTQSRQGWLLN